MRCSRGLSRFSPLRSQAFGVGKTLSALRTFCGAKSRLQEIGYEEIKKGFLKSQAIHYLKINKIYDTEYIDEECVKLLSDYLAGDNKTALNIF